MLGHFICCQYSCNKATPRSNREWLDYGSVSGESIYYAPDADDGCPFPHRRKVEWAGNPLRRWDLSIPFQNTLGARRTVFRVSHVGEFLEGVGISKPVKGSSSDPYEIILRRVLEIDPSEFKDLTKALLEALGFEETEGVEVAGRSGDGSVDFIGELNVANLARVKLFVQANRCESGRVSEKAVEALREVVSPGCQGAVITTSQFDSKAREAAGEPGLVPIGLMDGRQLVDLLVEHWTAEPLVPFHEQLGLKPGLVPV